MSNSSKRVRVGWERSRDTSGVWQLIALFIALLVVIGIFIFWVAQDGRHPNAIDDLVKKLTGDRERFWVKPHG